MAQVHEGLAIKALWTIKKWSYNKNDKSALAISNPNQWETICQDEPNLYTNGGRDWIAAQLYTNNAAGTVGANFCALSENAGGASASHTSVAGEITTNGLARKIMVDRTHTAGTNVTTLHDQWTASASFTAVQLLGLLTASSGGTLVNEKAFTSTPLNTNDILDVTITITGPATGT